MDKQGKKILLFSALAVLVIASVVSAGYILVDENEYNQLTGNAVKLGLSTINPSITDEKGDRSNVGKLLKVKQPVCQTLTLRELEAHLVATRRINIRQAYDLVKAQTGRNLCQLFGTNNHCAGVNYPAFFYFFSDNRCGLPVSDIVHYTRPVGANPDGSRGGSAGCSYQLRFQGYDFDGITLSPDPVCEPSSDPSLGESQIVIPQDDQVTCCNSRYASPSTTS